MQPPLNNILVWARAMQFAEYLFLWFCLIFHLLSTFYYLNERICELAIIISFFFQNVELYTHTQREWMASIAI